MPVITDVLRVSVRWTSFGEPCQNVGYFNPIGAAFLTADCTAVAQAIWNDFKTDYRALMPSDPTKYLFKEVFVEELNSGTGIGTYPVPLLEQGGTRTYGATNTGAPVWNSFSVKLSVGTRATRPGGKRWSPLFDQDFDDDRVLSGSVVALSDNYAALWGTTRILGAPVASGTLVPIVATLATPLTTSAWQEINGYYVNPLATHQTTRGN